MYVFEVHVCVCVEITFERKKPTPHISHISRVRPPLSCANSLALSHVCPYYALAGVVAVVLPRNLLKRPKCMYVCAGDNEPTPPDSPGRHSQNMNSLFNFLYRMTIVLTF